MILVLSLWFLLFPFLFKAEGVRVVSINGNAECGSLKIGDSITQIEGKLVNNKQEFDIILKSVVKDRPVTLIVNGGPGRCTALDDGELGIQVADVSSKGFRFGVDLVGGDKFLVASADGLSPGDVSYISNVFEKRLKVSGLQDSRVSVDGSSIAIYAPAGSNIDSILVHGDLEGLIEQGLKLTNGTAKIKVGNASQEIFWNGSNITVGNAMYGLGKFFSINGLQFKAVNATNDSIIVDALVLDNSNIATIGGSAAYVKYDAQSKKYQFSVPVEVNEDGSKKFSEITKGLIPLYGSNSDLLNGLLVYWLDGTEIARLSIPSNFAGIMIKSISIIGGDKSMEEAVNTKSMVEVALEGRIGKAL
jgi:hypothetical protein